MNTTSVGRLTRKVRELQAAGTKPLVPFLTAGYPDEKTFVALLAAVAAAGCPLVEIGIPFSDPVADGPVIQASSQQALARGMTLARTLVLARAAAIEHGLTVVMMGYLNPILRMGPEHFAGACAEARIAGVIIPDLPPEEAAGIRALLAAGGTDLVDLVAPTTDPQRLARILPHAAGFLYLVSTTGVTGVTGAAAGSDTLPAYVARVRGQTDLPLYVGFGIAEPSQAAQVATLADGAIVGSALIRVISAAGDNAVAAAATYLGRMVQAMQPVKGFPS
jgi:tryptophan synthase alpha chain